MTSIEPEFWTDHAAEAVGFYERAFGAVTHHRVGDGDDIVVQLAIGAARFWVAAAAPDMGRFSPDSIGGRTGRTLLVVDDPDAVAAQAVSAGATEASRVSDEHGWRVGRVVDPYGHEWEIGKPLGDWPPAPPADRGQLPAAATGGRPLAPPVPQALSGWHAAVAARDPAQFDDLLADDTEFRSPAVFAPQRGKAAASLYLAAAVAVLGPSLRYVHEWYDSDSAALEFDADLDGMYVQGVDLLAWNAAGKLTGVTVLVRPLRGLEKVVELMRAQLAGLHG